jgi:MFS family permease
MQPAQPARLTPPISSRPIRWYQGLTPYHWWVFCVGALAWLFDCTDQRIFMLARSPGLSQLLHLPQTHPLVVDYATWATAATMAGWALGGLFFGVVGDRWGRVKTLATCIFLYSLFTGLCGLATTWWDFCLYRLLMGGGIGGAFAAAATLIAETMPDHARSFCLGLFSALSVLGNMSGSVLARWLFLPEETYTLKWLGVTAAGWRLLFFVGAVPALLSVLVIPTLRESDKWKAARALARDNLTRQMGDLKSMFGHPRWRRHTLVAVGMATAGIVGVWGVGFWSPELISKALTPAALRGQILPPDIAQHIGRVKAIATILQDVGGFLGILTLTVLANHVRRRVSFTAVFLGGFLSIALAFLTLHSEWQAYVLLPLVGYFTIGVMGGFVIYFPEIFPTRLRSTGTAFGYNVARLSAAVVMVLGNSIREGFRQLGVADPFRVGAVTLGGIYLLGLLVLLRAPETRGQPLMEDD